MTTFVSPDFFNPQQTEPQLSLQTILALSPAGIGITRLSDGKMVDFNDALLEIIGYERKDILGETSSVLNIWHDLEERTRVFARLKAGETIRELPSRIRRKNGELRYVRFSASTCQVAGEKFMIGTLRDVTAEQLAENERQIAEKRLRLSLAVMPITVFHQDLDLRYTCIVNPQINQSVENIVGYFDQDLFEAEDAAVLTAIKRRVLASGIGERHEIPVQLGRQRFWFDTLVEAERDPEGGIVGIICAGADITERKLREERYRTVLEDQTELISRYRPDGVFVYVNEVYCRFFGRTEAELLGKSWQPVAHPDDVSLIEAQLASMSPSKPVIVIENRVVAGDGSIHWMQFVNRGSFDAEGRVMETQSVGRDITQRKILEAELSDYRDRLQALLENIEHARENQRKDIARDIHDQLGAIHLSIGYRLDTLKRNTEDNPTLQSELLNIKSLILQAHETTKAICSQLRPPALDDLGLTPTCRWYLKDWSARVGIEARGRFSSLPEGLSAQLSTDLFRVFQELLTNVAKHSGASSVRIGLSDGRQGVQLRVADNGRGFIPSASGAHGYGLLGIRERMQRHGGQVTIKSNSGGTVVTVTIPCRNKA